MVRPLARTYQGHAVPATPPARVETWREDTLLLGAEGWTDLRRADADADADRSPFVVLALHDPRFRAPLLLATPLAAPARSVRDCDVDRWPIEQLPLAAKQLLGATRQFVHALETCQRLPELALLAGAVLSSYRRYRPGHPDGLLGSPPAADPRPPTPPPRADPRSARLSPARTHPRTSRRHQPPPHRLWAPTPPHSRRRRPVLGNRTGGLSGPAIKPVAVRMVYQVAAAVDLPLIGLGGIATLDDALEFFLAGASAVQLGTATFTNPGAMAAIIADLPAWLAREGFSSIADIIGLANQHVQRRAAEKTANAAKTN